MLASNKPDRHRVETDLLDLISTKDDNEFAQNWARLNEQLESIESTTPDLWSKFQKRHDMLRNAALRGREEAIKLLIQPFRKPDVNDKKAGPGETALHEAAYNGYATIVKLLLDYQATPNLLSKDTGESALHRALRRPRFNNPLPLYDLEATVQHLLNAGANPNLRDLEWRTPVYRAAQNSHASSLRLLLDNPGNHGNGNERDKNGNTPLHIAALKGHSVEAEVLLDAVNIESINHQKETPLYLAAKHSTEHDGTEWSDHNKTVKLLLDRGADRVITKSMTRQCWIGRPITEISPPQHD